MRELKSLLRVLVVGLAIANRALAAEAVTGNDPFGDCQPGSPHAAAQLQKVLKTLDYQGKPIGLCRSSLVPGIVSWTKLVGYEQHPFISYQKKPVVELYITYNPTFMDQLESLSRNKYATLALLAHEVGHHIEQHPAFGAPTEALSWSWQKEADADYYVGQTLARLQADPADLQATQIMLFTLWGDLAHPLALSRIQNLVDGWKSGGGAPVAVEELDSLRAIMMGDMARW